MSKLEKRTLPFRLIPREYPVLTWVVLFFICLALAVLIEGLVTDWKFRTETVPFLFIETLLPFVIVELMFVIFQGSAIEGEISEKAKEISDIALRNHSFFDTTHNVFRIFHYHGMPAHDALRLAALSMFRSFRIDEDYIEFEDEFLSRELYQNFWQTLVDVQRSHRRNGSQPDLVAFSTHSASIRLWKTNQFGPLMQLQKQFIDAGGTLYRVLIHSANSPDKKEEYISVVSAMKEIGIRVFYLDCETSIGELHHDYFLVSIDGLKYADIWRTDLDVHGYHGNIFGSIIEIGEDRVRKYHSRWMYIVALLKDKAKGPPRDLPSALTEVPTKKMFEEMEAGPRG